MTIKNVLIWAYKKLKDSDIKSASLDADVLLSFVLKKGLSLARPRDKEWLYANPEFRLNKKQFSIFKKLIDKRKKHYPIAHLTGYKEFYGLKFKINKHVLVPRPESEEIIDKTWEIINSKFIHNQLPIIIVDIGTGSGCLIITLAKKLQQNQKLDAYKLFATDISKKALKVAQKNAKHHQVEKHITFLKGPLLKPLKDQQIDLIITNLPYLTKEDVKKESSIKKEPFRALVGDLYPKLFKQIKKLDKKPIVIYEGRKGVNIVN